MQKRVLFGLIFLAAIVGGFILVLILSGPVSRLLTQAQIKPVPKSLAVAYPQPNGRSLGAETSPVKIEVFEDFQCPACNVYAQTVEPRILSDLVAPGKAVYIFRNYPFLDLRVSGGSESHQAANAGMCAAEQNKFWEFKALLFANQKAENSGGYSDERLLALAQTAGLEMEKFKACFAANAYKSEIDTDYALGYSLRIGGTPAVYVNGVNVKPGYIPSYDEIAAAVEAAQTKGP